MKKAHSIPSMLAVCSIFLLSGECLLVAPAQAAANGEAATQSDQPITDTWITTKVKAELATTDGVNSMDVGVTTVDGVVTLTGVLATDIAVKKATAAAQSVKGVKKVDATGLKSKD